MEETLRFSTWHLATRHLSLGTLMTELWLKFQKENGEIKRILVETEKFSIGRHSENDLSIADGRLSREHIKIDRFGDVFVVSDCDSSNGTRVNGEDLTEPVGLQNQDKLDLGGVEIEIELISDDPNAAGNGDNGGGAGAGDEENTAASVSAGNSSSASENSSGSASIWWLIPVFGVFFLIFAGGLLFVFSGNKEKETAKKDGGFIYSTKRDSPEDSTSKPDETPEPNETSTPASTPENTGNNSSSTSNTPTPDAVSTPQFSSEADKIGKNASSFMRQIAFNDPKPFLTSVQIEAVNSKISQLKGSATLADNLKSVKKNAAKFKELADSKNLKPQFLAIAALTKLGNTRGDALAAAETMLSDLTDLKGTLDNKLADDNLLTIAGYARKQAGNNTPLQNVIEGLSKSAQSENVMPREIRTIWFLKKKDKLSDAEFNFALQFLAIGIISQNPKDYNVNSDALTF